MTYTKSRLSRGQRAPSQHEPDAQLGGSPGAGPALRKTGFRFETEIPWGSHVGIFYETAKDLLDIIASYFKAGLESNELCVWALSDPVTMEHAQRYLRREISRFDEHLSNGQIEMFDGYEWYLEKDRFDSNRVLNRWTGSIERAFAKGFDGVRASGNAFWVEKNNRNEYYEYERALDHFLDGKKIITLCTYSIPQSRAVDIFDVASAHQFSLALRKGQWKCLESIELKRAKQEIAHLNETFGALSKFLFQNESLTLRERVVVAQIVKGAANKEIARILSISPRTVEFHRANIMRKLGVKNTVGLMRKVLDV